ncbi:MAG TPA: winged helix-turn-helix domain-containing protein [Bryobacteraceae bacterium]|nr:winged helix-turn-helix domain-containing protein [Bryobacteraceae bacterium]
MAAEATCYQFDNVEVQPAAFAVLKDGRALSLEPKAVRALLHLIENRDRAVSKEELIDAVWEGAAVTDNALTRIVAQLRRELGDDARQARYIQTLPTLGYRFIAPLRQASLPPTAAARPKGMILALSAGLLAAVAGGSAWLLSGHSPSISTQEFRPVQLTTSPGVDLGGSFSPDGISMAYSSNRSGRFEIYLRPVNPGGVVRQLTFDGKQNVEPQWSPDGKWVAYRSVASHGIWLIPAAGGTAHRLTEFGSSPAWSPDSRQIAFRSFEPYSLAWFDFPGVGDSTIWTVAADGSQLRRLTTAGKPGGQHAVPRWSPDGRRISFAALGGQPSLWTVNPTSGELKPLTEEAGFYFGSAAFDPRGRNVYASGLNKAGEFGIYRISLEGEKPVELYSTRNEIPIGVTVSPDGKRLLYTRISNVSQLWVTGPQGAGAKPIFEDAVLRAKLPVFSPDGKRLAYVVRSSGRADDIWTMNADGTGAVQVTTQPGVEGAPVWSSDGSSILYSHSDGNNHEFRRLNPADRSWRALGDHKERRVGMPHISPDEREVIFVRPAPLNLWRLRLADGATRQLTFDREGASFPTPSPDGKWLAYEVGRGNTTQIGIADRDGGSPRMLTDDPGLDWPNSWASDNRRLVFASYRDGVWNLYSIDRVTRERKQLTRYTGYGAFVRNPAWRPGTEEVVYEYSQVKGNVYSISLR